MPAQPCAVVSDWTVCSCGCCSWTYAVTIGCQGRSPDSCYTNQNYWSTWFFICLSVGLERFAHAFERPFHHFHNFQKTAENFFILKVLITVWITARVFEAICLIAKWRAANFCLIIIIIIIIIITINIFQNPSRYSSQIQFRLKWHLDRYWMNWYFIVIPPLKDVFRTTSSGIR